jgi:peptide/nickel transport system ATP-binding protein
MARKPDSSRVKGDLLLDMRDVRIEGYSDDKWHPIIKGVDLKLHRGEVMGLIGESGAGKSTLGKAAMGYVQPGCRFTGGTVMFDGDDLTRMSESQRRRLRGSRITYVAQSAAASFNPAHRLIDQCVEATVAHGLAAEDAAKADARELFRSLQLPDPDNIGQRYPHQVSGGQLQRAMTAMAMSSRPDLIIFDEPTTALDVTTQVEVLAAMRDIVQRFNTAAIYITHDLAVVAQMADVIKVLRYGETIEDAPARKMLKAPEQPYTKSLWAVRSLEKPEEQERRYHPSCQRGRCQLWRVGQGTARRDHRCAARFHRRGRGRVRFRQVDHGTRHHRAAAASEGQRPVQ